MRVAFMGTPEFAVPALRALAASHDVVAVYTRPDAVSGRGGRLRPSPVKQVAEELDLAVLQPPSFRADAALAEFADLRCDLCVVAAYGVILPRSILEQPVLGCVNIHASLLPRWRGAAPVQRAILAGDLETGVSIMRMEEGLDTGPYCLQLTTTVADKDSASLTAELADLGAKALTEVLPSIAVGSVRWLPQDDSRATYAEKIRKSDVALDPHLDVVTAMRRIRASSSAAPARVQVGGIGVTVLEAALAPSLSLAAGQFTIDGGPALGLSDGSIRLLRIKPEGKQAMDAASWARGLRLVPDIWRAAE